MSSGIETRKIAIEALERIQHKGAFANLVLGPMIERTSLSARDRAFVTELVYGTTRMRRALDHLIDPFLHGEVDDHVRTVLQLGTYQLHYMDTPPHAAVDATVGSARKRVRGLINAVLRRVAEVTPEFPTDGIRLSYPDWMIERLSADIGRDQTIAALEAMNRPAITHTRADGYVQDPASQEVVAMVNAGPGDVVVDLCAAPGGKATGISHGGAHVVAGDLRLKRARLMARNAKATGSRLATLAADARRFPVRPGSADIVLLDAPCSGIGSLRRRPDARWRIDRDAPERLGQIQRQLLAAALPMVKPGGRLVYSVCTMTAAETTAVVAGLEWHAISDPVFRLPDSEGDGMWSQIFRAP
ncbi:MAG: transcription antitermination factor NusB [Acidimicrobiales bacterium]